MKKYLISLILLLFFPLTTLAAPAPWGIAINNQTKECAVYWSGDEFTHYRLPEGWQEYYPANYDGSREIGTPYGKCNFENEEVCCQELGLKYITGNIGERQNIKMTTRINMMYHSGQLFESGAIVLFLLVIIVLFIIIRKIRKKIIIKKNN